MPEKWLNNDVHLEAGNYTGFQLVDILAKLRVGTAPAKKVQVIPVPEPDMDAPPGTSIVFSTLDFISGKKKYLDEAMGTLVSKSAKGKETPKRSTREFMSAALKMGIPVSVDWVFNRMTDDGVLKVPDIINAFKGDRGPLLMAMRAWGLSENGVVSRSKASRSANSDAEIKALLKAASIPAGASGKDKIPGSAESVMRSLWDANLSLSEEVKGKLVCHLRDKLDEPSAALKPLLKLLGKKDEWTVAGELMKKLSIDDKRVSVDHYIDALEGNWSPIYGGLCQNLQVKGKVPPWLAKA